MKKKIISFITSVTMALTCLGGGFSEITSRLNLTSKPIVAEAVRYGYNIKYGDYLTAVEVYEDEDDICDYIEISDCDTSATSIEIPSEINDLPVASIANWAFGYCQNLESVTIPDSVKNVGYYAFYRCTSLSSITIPDSVTNIQHHAFYDCKNLENITIPDSVTSIGSWAFYRTAWIDAKRSENPLVIVNGILIDGTMCEGDVILPDGVSSIGDSAFSGCSKLTSIKIPDCVRSIEKYAFDTCTNLETIIIRNPDCEIYNDNSTISNSFDEENENYYFYGTIYGYEDSTAQTYAENYDKNFVSLSEIVLGDITGDGNINLYDAIDICKYIMNMRTLTPYEEICADFDENGIVDLYDVIGVAKKLLE